MDTGNTWFKRVIGDLESWLDRGHGSPDFYLTQFFTGHGLFGSYLHKRKLALSDRCVLCKYEIDTPEHTFFACDGLSNERSKLEECLGEGLVVENIVPLMLESKENWFRIRNYVKDCLVLKKNASPPADAVPHGSSGVSASN